MFVPAGQTNNQSERWYAPASMLGRRLVHFQAKKKQYVFSNDVWTVRYSVFLKTRGEKQAAQQQNVRHFDLRDCDLSNLDRGGSSNQSPYQAAPR